MARLSDLQALAGTPGFVGLPKGRGLNQSSEAPAEWTRGATSSDRAGAEGWVERPGLDGPGTLRILLEPDRIVVLSAQF